MAEQKTATKATSQPKPMTIHTCYVVDIKSQLVTEKGEVTGSRRSVNVRDAIQGL